MKYILLTVLLSTQVHGLSTENKLVKVLVHKHKTYSKMKKAELIDILVDEYHEAVQGRADLINPAYELMLKDKQAKKAKGRKK